MSISLMKSACFRVATLVSALALCAAAGPVMAKDPASGCGHRSKHDVPDEKCLKEPKGPGTGAHGKEIKGTFKDCLKAMKKQSNMTPAAINVNCQKHYPIP